MSLRSNRSFVAAAALAALVSLAATHALAEPSRGVSVSAAAAFEPRSDVDETKKELLKLRDEADDQLVVALADIGTRPAMEALLEVYDAMASIWMRREVVRALGRFDRVEDAFQPALDKVMSVATEATEPELRDAALETLGKATEHGKTFLALIVDSPARDDIRIEAMRLHTKLGSDSDNEWYKKQYERQDKDAADNAKKDKPKRPKKGEEEEKTLLIVRLSEIRRLAMEALLPALKDQDLLNDFREDRSLTIRRTALTELHKRKNPSAGELARELLDRVDTPDTMRAFCAGIVAQIDGAKVVDDFIDLAKKRDVTQQVLRDKMADLLAEMKDEKVNKKLLSLVGKGKPHEKAFALRATRLIQDDKLMEKVRKGLKEKDPEILAATLQAVAARKDKAAIGDLEKMLEKSKDPVLNEGLLETLSALYDGDNNWVERLKGFADSPVLEVRNAAIYELGRLGRKNLFDFFVAKLSDENWSTRYAAMRALEALRTTEAIGALVKRLPEESGRVEVLMTDMLWRLTGKPFGKRVSAWTSWWQNEGAGFEPIDAEELSKLELEAEERRLRQISSVAEFFGIRIESHRVIFIIDVSGSMAETLRPRYVGEQGETRMVVAKRELAKAIEGLDPKALFNILPFSSGMERWRDEGIATATQATREDALGYVKKLDAGGGTNIYGALELAFQDPDVDTIVVLSDGEPSVGEVTDAGLIREAVKEWNDNRAVQVHAVAVGGSLQLLKWIAEDNGGDYVEYN
ncbi:MAG: HEAT repeat domain-containing protein [Planctomycetota bacterium]